MTNFGDRQWAGVVLGCSKADDRVNRLIVEIFQPTPAVRGWYWILRVLADRGDLRKRHDPEIVLDGISAYKVDTRPHPNYDRISVEEAGYLPSKSAA